MVDIDYLKTHSAKISLIQNDSQGIKIRIVDNYNVFDELDDYLTETLDIDDLRYNFDDAKNIWDIIIHEPSSLIQNKVISGLKIIGSIT